MSLWHSVAGVVFGLLVLAPCPLPLAAQTAPPVGESLTDQLLDDGPLLPAADAPAPPGGAELANLGEQMEHVGRRLRIGLLDRRTRALQEEIAQQLETLLEHSVQRSSSSQQSSAAPRGSDEQQQASTAAAERPGSGAEGRQPEETGLFRRRSLNAIWGHLPERLQEQIRNPLRDDFLPAYRQRISDYYERLSEAQ